MQNEKFWKVAPFILPAIWAIVIVTNVWYHGPKGWIFVSIGMLIMIGILTHIAINAFNRADAHKQTIEKLNSEMRYNESIKDSKIAKLGMILGSSYSRIFETLRVISAPYPQTWRRENWIREFGKSGNMLVLYASLPTADGWRQIRWELSADDHIGYNNDNPVKEPDPVLTEEETFTNLKAHLRWLADENRVLPPE